MNIAQRVAQSSPPERTFNVWARRNGVIRHLGYVKGVNHTLADKRAANLYGHDVWTTERD